MVCMCLVGWKKWRNGDQVRKEREQACEGEGAWLRASTFYNCVCSHLQRFACTRKREDREWLKINRHRDSSFVLRRYIDGLLRAAKLTKKAGLAVSKIFNEGFFRDPIKSKHIHRAGLNATATATTKFCVYFPDSHPIPPELLNSDRTFRM